jgi:hypothetical protein
MGDHRDTNTMELVFTLCPLDDFFQGIEGPIHSDESFPLRTFSPRPRKSAEMTFSQAAFLIVEEKI